MCSRNLDHYAFEPDGPMGECLFPQDSLGNIVYIGVIECEYSSDTIRALIDEWVHCKENLDGVDVDDYFKGITKITFDAQLPVGKRLFSAPVGVFEQVKSEVGFRCIIDIRDTKFRYALIQFHTQRRHVRGNAKSEGSPNVLHWHRVNNLKKDISNSDELERLLQSEYESYRAEYSAVCDFIESLENVINITDF